MAKKKTKVMHRWKAPGGVTMCGIKQNKNILTNVGYYLNKGVTCKRCKARTTRMSIFGDEWNGQSDGHPKGAQSDSS